MPNKRIEMDKIYEIQRLKKLGHTKAEVARIVGIIERLLPRIGIKNHHQR